MLKNYVKVALRNLASHKGYAIISIASLSIGLTCSILIMLWVRDELSYDRFYQNADRIYRVAIQETTSTSDETYPVTPGQLAEALSNDYPEVLSATRLSFRASLAVGYEDNYFEETRIHRADPNFFDIFQLPFAQGNPKTALENPSSVVITKSIARKYFGDEEPLGKTLEFRDGITYSTPFKITGVIEDFPDNAHFHADFLQSWLRKGDQPRTYSNWGAYSFYTYILLDHNNDGEALEAKFPAMVQKYFGPQIEERGITYEEHLAAGNGYRYFLQQITAIHLESDMGWEIEANGNLLYVYLFTGMALFVLAIACINYVNLSTARSAERFKEIGIRKVLGSERRQLIVQFLSESIFVTLFALLLAALFVELLLPGFNDFLSKRLYVDYFGEPFVLPGLLGFAVVIGLFSGIWPAFFMSKFRPIIALRGAQYIGVSRNISRNGLVIFQFIISIVLIVGTLVIQDQLNYIQSRNLGFDRQNIVVIEKAWALGDQRESYKQELLKHPNIIGVSVSESLPGKSHDERFVFPEDRESGEQYNISLLVADHDFVETLGLEVAEGRAFDKNRLTDSSAVMINETAAELLGLSGDPIGKRIGISRNRTNPVIGVIKDYHFKSLHTEITPLVYFIGRGTMAYAVVRIRSQGVSETMEILRNIWDRFVPNQPFHYSFLDENFAQLYAADQRTKRLFMVFSLLAILIACLGLLGLSAFIAERRTKEIGVRKVLGATVPEIFILIAGSFTKLVTVAFVVASPIAYFVMTKWLQNFAYRIEIQLWMLALTGAMTLMVALLTVSVQAIRAALVNPVESLRYE